jgi:mRNA interferase RelE/StbE
MRYEVAFYRRAIRDLDSLSPEVARRILVKIEAMRADLSGDVKRLTSFMPEYRLRVGNYRVLFELKESQIVIHAVRHRRDVYER